MSSLVRTRNTKGQLAGWRTCHAVINDIEPMQIWQLPNLRGDDTGPNVRVQVEGLGMVQHAKLCRQAA